MHYQTKWSSEFFHSKLRYALCMSKAKYYKIKYFPELHKKIKKWGTVEQALLKIMVIFDKKRIQQ